MPTKMLSPAMSSRNLPIETKSGASLPTICALPVAIPTGPTSPASSRSSPLNAWFHRSGILAGIEASEVKVALVRAPTAVTLSPIAAIGLARSGASSGPTPRTPTSSVSPSVVGRGAARARPASARR